MAIVTDSPRFPRARRRPPRKQEPIKYEIRGRDGVRPAFVIDERTGCWNSSGPSTGNGYRGSAGKPAHKDAFIRMHGAIPPGFDVHHLCLNPECVNAAEHLIILSRRDHAKLHAYLRSQSRRG